MSPDDQKTTQNQDSVKNSIPSSPQEPMADVPVPATVSEPSNMPPEAPESPKNTDIPVSFNNYNPQNEPISTQNPIELKLEESPPSAPLPEEIPPVSAEPATRTAQIPVNEPLNPEPEPLEFAPILIPQPQPVSAPVFFESQQKKISLARELLVKARNMIQFRKRKKLDRVMSLFLKKSKITNDEIREFLHVSDATAERYLNTLEKENKIKQTGKTGHSVFYIKI